MSHPIPLGDGHPSSTIFAQGKESEFEVDLEGLGELAKIRLEHDGRNSDPSWHVDWVILECSFPIFPIQIA